MRGLPNMTVLSPSDDVQTRWAIKEAAKIDGPVYVRLHRSAVPGIYEKDTEFELGKAIVHGDGCDATVFATGDMTSVALTAKEELEKEGINIRVVDIHTIKPIDKEAIIKCAKETKKLISIEDHSVINGLGSAIADVLIEEYPKKLVKIGMNDEFGKSGKAGELLKYFKLTPEHIIEEVKK
jgi:transketolase